MVEWLQYFRRFVRRKLLDVYKNFKNHECRIKQLEEEVEALREEALAVEAGTEKELEEALEAAGAVVLITGRTDVDSLELLADVHAARGEEDASQAAWRDLLLVDPQHPRARSSLGLED